MARNVLASTPPPPVEPPPGLNQDDPEDREDDLAERRADSFMDTHGVDWRHPYATKFHALLVPILKEWNQTGDYNKGRAQVKSLISGELHHDDIPTPDAAYSAVRSMFKFDRRFSDVSNDPEQNLYNFTNTMQHPSILDKPTPNEVP
jgi:hypothetical protein